MRRTVFGRLLRSHFLVAMAALVVGGGAFAYLLVRGSVGGILEDYRVQAVQVADLVQRMPPEQVTALMREPAALAGGGTAARTLVVDRATLSRLSAQAGTGGHDAWRGRPLAGALTGETAGGIRFTDGGPVWVVAAPLWQGGAVAGAVVLQAPLGPWGTMRYQPLIILLYCSLAAAAIAALLSWRISRGIALPVARASAAARRLSEGNLDSRVEWRAPDELGALADSFNRMAAELQRLELSRRDLMANASHELKGPVARVQLALSMIQEGVGTAAGQERLLATALRETERLGALVGDLLEFSRLQAGRLVLYPAAIDLGGLLHRVLEGFRPQAAAAGVTLSGSWGDLPTVECDARRVEQIVGNLLDNALKFTPAGGRVDLTAAAVGDSVEIAAADTGPGIPPDEQERIWERFYKADPARTPAPDPGHGAGLGLAIARQLVELHGGRVTVESAPGAGARLGFVLPLRAPAAGA